ncbi:MAG: SpoIVB peptidase S55 domain-containing protein [Vicinamibacterales bacterium]
MNIRRVAIALSLSLLALSTLRAATPQMSIDDIRPGMVGIGHTVFSGTQVEEFKAHIIGVIENVIGTQRNLILAKLEGGPLAETGVIAGMSGSPVYIDGKLIGAVSYALGSFPKQPIAGITPIAEMTDATAMNTARPAGARVHVQFPLEPQSLLASFRQAMQFNRPFAERAGDAQLVGVSNVSGFGAEVGTMLRPIATPLVMSGFEPPAADALASTFRNAGFVPMGAGAAALRPGMAEFSGPLKPGDAVGVTFVSGDLELGATGTVTHIDENRVYAFGHPMYNLGPIDFPMTRAYVYTVLPSLMSSAKLSSTGEIIGAFNQDRATAIAGRLGPGPSLMPVTMTLDADRASSTRSFKFSAVKDQLFGPLMTYTALVNTLTSYERQFGTTTYSVQGRLKLKGHDPILLDNMFAGENAASNTSAYIIAPVTAMVNNDYESVDLEGLEIAVKSSEQPRSAQLERVWLDDPRPRPGRTVPLKVLLRSYRGEDIIQTIPIEIPANARGTLALTVSDGQRLNQTEQREARVAQPRTVPQLVKALNRTRRNNVIYVKLMSSDNGAVVAGELLPSLPPSVLAVIESDRSGGSPNALQTATLGEWQLRTEQAISGVRSLTIQLSAN